MDITQNDVFHTPTNLKILMDSGTIASIIYDSQIVINKFNNRETSINKWPTMAWSLLKSYEAKVKI